MYESAMKEIDNLENFIKEKDIMAKKISSRISSLSPRKTFSERKSVSPMTKKNYPNTTDNSSSKKICNDCVERQDFVQKLESLQEEKDLLTTNQQVQNDEFKQKQKSFEKNIEILRYFAFF